MVSSSSSHVRRRRRTSSVGRLLTRTCSSVFTLQEEIAFLWEVQQKIKMDENDVTRDYIQSVTGTEQVAQRRALSHHSQTGSHHLSVLFEDGCLPIRGQVSRRQVEMLFKSSLQLVLHPRFLCPLLFAPIRSFFTPPLMSSCQRSHLLPRAGRVVLFRNMCWALVPGALGEDDDDAFLQDVSEYS